MATARLPELPPPNRGEPFELTFARVLREVFRDDPWDVIEEYAGRSWSLLAPDRTDEWERVKEQVRAYCGHI